MPKTYTATYQPEIPFGGQGAPLAPLTQDFDADNKEAAAAAASDWFRGTPPVRGGVVSIVEKGNPKSVPLVDDAALSPAPLPVPTPSTTEGV